MCQVVKRIRSIFSPHGELRDEINNLREIIVTAKEQVRHSNQVVESLREQVERESRAWHDGTRHSKGA